MKLSEWIVNYANENNIELPSGIPDEKTALRFLGLDKNGSGGGGGESNGSAFDIILTDVQNDGSHDHFISVMDEAAIKTKIDANDAITAFINMYDEADPSMRWIYPCVMMSYSVEDDSYSLAVIWGSIENPTTAYYDFDTHTWGI